MPQQEVSLRDRTGQAHHQQAAASPGFANFLPPATIPVLPNCNTPATSTLPTTKTRKSPAIHCAEAHTQKQNLKEIPRPATPEAAVIEPTHDTTRSVSIATRLIFASLLPCLLLPPFLPVSSADDHARLIELQTDNTTYVGRLLKRSGDHVWLMDPLGSLFQLNVRQVSAFKVVADRFQPATPDEQIRSLQKELLDGYEVTSTQHYVVAAPIGNAQQFAKTLEQLYQEVYACCQNLGLSPQHPEMPLKAIIFFNEQHFQRCCRTDQMAWSADLTGYYSIRSNRISVLAASSPLTSTANDGNQISVRPQQPSHVSQMVQTTLIHEACHQIGFNSGIHSRISHGPKWLVEGLAMHLESDNVRRGKSDRLLSPADTANPERLHWFQTEYLPRQQPGDLARLITSDEHFARAPFDAYSLAWAFTWFLCSSESPELPRKLADFVRLTAKQPGPGAGSATQRLETFQRTLGDPDLLETQLLRFIDSLNLHVETKP